MTEKTYKIIEVCAVGVGSIASGLVGILVEDKSMCGSLCAGITALTSAVLYFCESFIKKAETKGAK